MSENAEQLEMLQHSLFSQNWNAEDWAMHVYWLWIEVITAITSFILHLSLFKKKGERKLTLSWSLVLLSMKNNYSIVMKLSQLLVLIRPNYIYGFHYAWNWLILTIIILFQIKAGHKRGSRATAGDGLQRSVEELQTIPLN